MSENLKLNIYIEELKQDGPVADVDAVLGTCICDYIKASNIEKVTDAREREKYNKLNETINNYLIDWWIFDENNEQKLLDFNDKAEENKHKIKEKVTNIYGTIKPFSYHTFLFPFLWKDDKKVKTRKNFTKCLKISNTGNWIKENADSSDFADGKFNEKYNQYHYFNPAARNAIYSNGNDENEVVQNYKYSISCDGNWLNSVKNINNQAKYVIEINETDKYELSLNAIRLKLFNTGIGILIFETENYVYPTLEAINKINDFGRRIYMPFSSGEEKICGGCAERIYITYNGRDLFGALKEDYNLQKPEHFNTTRISALIKKLLTNGEYSITTDQKEKSKKVFYIEPVIDDRMFVACYCINKELASAVSQWSDDNYAYINAIRNPEYVLDNGTNLAKELYKFIYVDGGDDPTCQSKNLFEEMLGKKYIYDRWIENGSLTGITEYSLVTVTNSTWEVLSNNFLTEYIEMLILVLAQRATLLNFERMLSDSALNKNDIRKIHRSYLSFQGQLLLKEVTPQQQGIELYRMMLDNLFINEQVAEIENQIEDAFAQKTADNESSENRILFLLAILGIFDMVGKFFEWLNTSAINGKINGVDCPRIIELFLSVFGKPSDSIAFLTSVLVMGLIIFVLKYNKK